MLCCYAVRRAALLLLCIGAAVSAAADSPYIARVWEYCPAPGQFVNELPEYEEDDSPSMMRVKADECLADDAQVMISLGSWGGYVVFGFDHMVENRPGLMDLQVLGNAFVANSNPNPDKQGQGGSSEPGIVMVSYDSNANGKPDDPWYELAGSEYDNPATRHHYTVTYYRTPADHTATPDNDYKYLTDTTYIRWRDSEGGTGYVSHNSSHTQSYWPLWSDADSLVFSGTRLPDNYTDESGNGSYYVQYAYRYGYADNQPNGTVASKLNIEWAVDSTGQSVELPGIHFVKVYTGVLQYCGWLGETSTEVLGAADLHVTGGVVPDTASAKDALPMAQGKGGLCLLTTLVHDNLIYTSSVAEQVQVLDRTGQPLFSANTNPGTSYLPCSCLPQGLYLLRTANGETRKFIKL